MWRNWTCSHPRYPLQTMQSFKCQWNIYSLFIRLLSINLNYSLGFCFVMACRSNDSTCAIFLRKVFGRTICIRINRHREKAGWTCTAEEIFGLPDWLESQKQSTTIWLSKGWPRMPLLEVVRCCISVRFFAYEDISMKLEKINNLATEKRHAMELITDNCSYMQERFFSPPEFVSFENR